MLAHYREDVNDGTKTMKYSAGVGRKARAGRAGQSGALTPLVSYDKHTAEQLEAPQHWLDLGTTISAYLLNIALPAPGDEDELTALQAKLKALQATMNAAEATSARR